MLASKISNEFEQFVEIIFSSFQWLSERKACGEGYGIHETQTYAVSRFNKLKTQPKKGTNKDDTQKLMKFQGCWFSSKVQLPFRVLLKLNSRFESGGSVLGYKIVYWIIVEMSYIYFNSKIKCFSTLRWIWPICFKTMIYFKTKCKEKFHL